MEKKTLIEAFLKEQMLKKANLEEEISTHNRLLRNEKQVKGNPVCYARGRIIHFLSMELIQIKDSIEAFDDMLKNIVSREKKIIGEDKIMSESYTEYPEFKTDEEIALEEDLEEQKEQELEKIVIEERQEILDFFWTAKKLFDSDFLLKERNIFTDKRIHEAFDLYNVCEARCLYLLEKKLSSIQRKSIAKILFTVLFNRGIVCLELDNGDIESNCKKIIALQDNEIRLWQNKNKIKQD